MLPLLLLLGCGAPLPPFATLPPAFNTAGDPLRGAVLLSAFAFNQPAQATPAARLRAHAMLEWMAADFRWNPRWSEFTPVLGQQLDAARAEQRAALGMAPGLSPQAAVDALFAAAWAVETGAAPPVQPDAFPQRDRFLAAIVTPPALPVAAGAVSLAEAELRRIDTSGRFNGDGGSGGAHP
ncbi:hypothetical protein [Roseococcus sp. DSY-14]|uniref:hypothetical protein n=1 Tax=Roseococcus sp. DSY-14 TaxID=3369650 RepID=UPI00387B8FA9